MGEYNLAEARMLVIWLGVLFVIGGLLFMGISVYLARAAQ
jgi:hypothetical protein